MDTSGTGPVRVIQSSRESNKGGKEKKGPTLGVSFTEVSALKRCPVRAS